MSTSIEWCDETWNAVVGCSRVSAGCDHCYAMGVAHRKMSPQHVGLTKLRPRDARRPGVDWTGEVRCLPERLAEPLRWRKPRRVFVNSMSDLFHPSVPFEFIGAVFGVMAACREHTFLVLTKRPERAVDFFAYMLELSSATSRAKGEIAAPSEIARRCAGMYGLGISRGDTTTPWPLPNVHLGVSAEEQATWDERVPLLLQCPAAVRWVSAEPLLGPIDLAAVSPGRCDCEVCSRTSQRCTASRSPLDWIVVGGESGPGARTCHTAWIRSIVAQCHDAAVPAFVKQLGRFPVDDGVGDGRVPFDEPMLLSDRKGGDMAEWPADLRCRELPEVRHGA